LSAGLSRRTDEAEHRLCQWRRPGKRDFRQATRLVRGARVSQPGNYFTGLGENAHVDHVSFSWVLEHQSVSDCSPEQDLCRHSLQVIHQGGLNAKSTSSA
jgi:hypothetical protein